MFGPNIASPTAQVSTVVFDKTGTLTTGRASVTGVLSLDREWDNDKVTSRYDIAVLRSSQVLNISPTRGGVVKHSTRCYERGGVHQYFEVVINSFCPPRAGCDGDDVFG